MATITKSHMLSTQVTNSQPSSLTMKPSSWSSLAKIVFINNFA